MSMGTSLGQGITDDFYFEKKQNEEEDTPAGTMLFEDSGLMLFEDGAPMLYNNGS